MEKTRILFISQEITPYVTETEMSVIGRYLPQGIQEKGREIRAFMPRFGTINERRNQLHEVIRLSGMNLIIDDTDHPLIIKVASIQSARMQVYFIDNDDYFQRKTDIFDKNEKPFADNDERVIFFARGVLETVKKLRWSPDLIHCHGWFTGLVPIFLKKAYKDNPLFRGTKVVYSAYNDELNMPFNEKFRKKIKVDGITDRDTSILKEPTYENLIKLAIQFSDGVICGHKTIPSNIEEHLTTLKKPVLPYKSPEEYIDAYYSFYDKILGL